MQTCIQKTISSLKSKNPSEFKERVLEAALLIEKWRGLSCYKGISAAVDDANFTSDEIADLRAALISFSKTHREHPDVGSALWALSKFQDEALKEFFLSEMRHHLEMRNHFALSQANFALHDFGEGVRYDYSPNLKNYDEFFETVRKYLVNTAERH